VSKDKVSVQREAKNCTKSSPSEVIFAGSEEKSNIFSLADLTWRRVPPMPTGISNTSPGQLSDGLLAMGGYYTAFMSNSISVDTIYKFSQVSEEWQLLEGQGFRVARTNPATVAVPKAFFAHFDR